MVIKQMISIAQIHSLIHQANLQSLGQYLDEIIAGQLQNQSLQKYWPTHYSDDKIDIISILHKKYQECLTTNTSMSLHSAQISLMEQCLIKLFAKGLILPDLNVQQDICLLTQVITHSQNAKYLFILYQQNICQIRLIYQSRNADHLDKVQLKLLFVASSFIKSLLGHAIFEEVVNKVHQFYVESDKVLGEENIIEQSDKQLQDFISEFTNNTLLCLFELFNEEKQAKTFGILRQKPVQRSHLFRLIKLIHSRSNQIQIKSKILTLLDKLVSKMNICLTKISQVPTFWVSEHIKQISSIYSPNQTLHYFGTILINQLPSKPEYSKLSHHLFPLIHQICLQIFSDPLPIQSLSLKDNTQFFILLFERFSILMGLLNKQQQDQNQINLMLNAIFNKKNLFSSPVLSETIWRILLQRHDDMNFRMFCMGQYKKVFSLSVKQLQKSSVHVIINAYTTLSRLLKELEPNSNAQFIGFHITLTIYLIACINKVRKFFIGQVGKQMKSKLILNYYLSEEKVKQMKQRLKETLMKLKEGLKDRLQVYKMKSESSKNNEKQQKEASQVSICIYRIEEEIKFD